MKSKNLDLKDIFLISPCFKKNSNNKNVKIRKDNSKLGPFSLNIFRNSELKKSLSTHSKFNYYPINQEIQSYLKYNHNKFFIFRKPKQHCFQDLNINNGKKTIITSRNKFQLKALNNDDNFFSTCKSMKKIDLYDSFFIIRKRRINHDINKFNRQLLMTDYNKNYIKNSYKIKKIIESDTFTNKIKKDLFNLKYNSQIKPFNDL